MYVKRLSKIGLVVLLASCWLTPITAQVWNTHKTLLWKVSGKGLKKPSYLYGTMHLRDERVYDFNDSVYAKLEECEAVALELHPDSAYRSLFDLAINASGNNSLPGDLTFNVEAFIRQAPWSLLLFNHRFDDEQNPRPTFLDGYFYHVGRRTGRKVIGVEHFKEQWDIDDFNGATVQLQNLFGSLPKLLGMIRYRDLLGLYQEADIGTIEERSSDVYTEGFYRVLLTDRNVRMADRLDSIMHDQSTFVAVGCGHLPGDSGLIELLADKGYLVTPIVAPKSGLKEPASLARKDHNWTRVELPGFAASFEVPYPPVAYHHMGIPGQVFLYPDIGTGIYYYAFGVPVEENNDSGLDSSRLDSLASLLIEYAPGEKLRSRDLEWEGRRVRENLLETEKGSIIQRIIVQDHRWVVLVVKAQQRNFHRKDVAQFFNSLQYKDPESQWQRFSVPEELISVEMPGIPQRYAPTQPMEYAWEERPYQAFRSIDPVTGLPFMVAALDVDQRQKHDHYSTELRLLDDDLNSAFGDKLKYSYAVRTQGTPSMSAWVEDHFGAQMIREVIHGNRTYYLAAGVHEKDSTDAMRFFNSLKFHSASNITWRPFQPKRGHYKTVFPCDSVTIKNNKRNYNYTWYSSSKESEIADTSLLEEYDCTCRDSLTFRKFWVEVEAIDSANYYSSDSLLYQTFLNQELSYQDSVMEESPWIVQGREGKQYWLKTRNEEYYQRLGFIQQGDRVFILTTEGRKAELDGPGNDPFFDEFEILVPDSGNPYDDPYELLMATLKVDDADSVKKALRYLDDYPFDSTHFERLTEAIIDTFPTDSSEDWQILQMLLKKSSVLNDSDLAGFLMPLYPSFPDAAVRRKVLSLMGDVDEPVFTKFVFEQLLTDTALRTVSNRHSTSYYWLVNQYWNNTEVYERHFTDLVNLLPNPDLSEPVLRRIQMLIDSNLIGKDSILAHENDWLQHLDWELYYRDTCESYDRNSSLAHTLNFVAFLAPEKSLVQKVEALVADSNSWLATSAILCLIEMGKSYDKKRLKNIAANDISRQWLVRRMHRAGRLEELPKSMLTMEMLAKSYLTAQLDEDYNIKKSELTEVVAYQDGDTAGTFYVFEVHYSWWRDEDTASWAISFNTSDITALDWNEVNVFRLEDEWDAYSGEEHIRRYLYKPDNPYLLEAAENAAEPSRGY